MLDVSTLTQQQQQVYLHYYSQGITAKQLFKRLTDAWWMANHAGFCDSMAGRLMAGESSDMIDDWQYACKHKYTIYSLCQIVEKLL